MTERKSREWWVVHDGMLSHVKGWDCGPMSPGAWWFPSLGFSAFEGGSVFETEAEAEAYARAWIGARRTDLDRAEAGLGAKKP